MCIYGTSRSSTDVCFFDFLVALHLGYLFVAPNLGNCFVVPHLGNS